MFRVKKYKADHYLALWIIHYFLIFGVFDLFTRSTDYLTGDSSTIGIVEINSNTPQTVWGLACLTSAIIIAVGMVRNKLRLQAAGCVVAGSIYCGFSAVTITRVFTIDYISHAHGVFGPILNYIGTNFYDFRMPFPVDDWRFSSDYFVEACRWFVLALFLIMIEAIRNAREE